MSVTAVCFWSYGAFSHCALMIVWTPPPCYPELPSSCCDVILSGGFTFVLRRCNTLLRISWIQMEARCTNIIQAYSCAVCACYGGLKLLLMSTGTPAVPFVLLSVFTQVPVVSYRTASVQQHSLSLSHSSGFVNNAYCKVENLHFIWSFQRGHVLHVANESSRTV